MTNAIYTISSVMMVASLFLILISLYLIYRTFNLIVKSLYECIYECNSNINYIKNKLEKQQEPKGKHMKLFEGEK